MHRVSPGDACSLTVATNNVPTPASMIAPDKENKMTVEPPAEHENSGGHSEVSSSSSSSAWVNAFKTLIWAPLKSAGLS
eukprot:scaffold3025_cov354-Prasinococcus_capsulatus_cf.AAC.1